MVLSFQKLSTQTFDVLTISPHVPRVMWTNKRFGRVGRVGIVYYIEERTTRHVHVTQYLCTLPLKTSTRRFFPHYRFGNHELPVVEDREGVGYTIWRIAAYTKK